MPRLRSFYLVKFSKPTLLDIDTMYELVQDEVKQGLIVNRTKDEIATNIRSYTVAKIDNNIVGFIALHIYNPYLAEIRSLIVTNQHRGNGIGYNLISKAIEEAHSLNVKDILVLTYKVELFKKFDFKHIQKEQIPEDKIWLDCSKCQYSHLTCGEVSLIKSNLIK